MQQFQARRAPMIVVMTAAIIVASAGLASAQAPSAERVANGGTELQVATSPVHTVRSYRAAQRLLDMLPDKAPNTGDDAFIYDDDTAFLSIFWMSYVPFVMVILWLIGDWVVRRFRKLPASFSLFHPLSQRTHHSRMFDKEMTHVQR
jgi:hypothetical protein